MSFWCIQKKPDITIGKILALIEVSKFNLSKYL